jgi:hypothetical protein
MATLEENWLTNGLIDFEYKKYMLLAYLQKVKTKFGSVRLYPYLSDLVLHYQNMVALKNNKQLLYSNFPQEISKADLETLSLHYKKMVEDDELMQELEAILTYAIPQFKTMLDEGKDIYEYVEKNLEIMPIGISPIHYQEGYFFLEEDSKKDLNIYEYQVTIFESANEKMRGIHTRFIESVSRGLGKTYVNMKAELVKKYRKLPNPATYLINSKVSCPVDETLLPIAKRLLVKYIYTHT